LRHGVYTGHQYVGKRNKYQRKLERKQTELAMH